jgi:ribosomal protein S18 acetylase RimI-like enzyme
MKHNRHSNERKVAILVDITILTVSFPLDVETSSEIQSLVRNNEELEEINYKQFLNLPVITYPLLKGFAVLAYAGDEVVGVITAIDMIGIHSYEWSALVHVDFRRQGLGHALIQELQRNLEIRGCESELALTIKESPAGAAFLQKEGYEWNFSEATLKAQEKMVKVDVDIDIVPFTSERQDLTQILMSTFGDTEDEVHTMLEFNVSSPSRHVFVAKKQQQVVGTVTAVEEGTTLWITALATDPIHQGQGIGSALLAFVREEGSRRESEAVMLDVEIDNDKALSVFEKAGFKPISQVDYYVKTPATS